MVFDDNKSLIVLFMCTLSFLVLTNTVYAFEPIKPKTNITLSSSKENNINQIKYLSIKDCYNQIKDIILLHDDDYTNKVIYESFKNRKKQAITYALDKLKEPIYSYETETPIHNIDLDAAKKVFTIFPNKSIKAILKAYRSSDPTTKVNLIKVVGNIEDNKGRAIERFLITALEDKTVVDFDRIEIVDNPLRVCDYAYNQLVYRYRIKKVLRSIGNHHSIETREYHIEKLINRL